MLQGIQRGVQEAGFGLLLDQAVKRTRTKERPFATRWPKALPGIMIFLQDGESYNAEVLRLVLGNFPVVLVDRYLRGVRCAVVSSDNEAGSQTLVEELLTAGHRRICLISFPAGHTSTIEDRVRGYVHALTLAGVAVDYSLHYVVSTAEEGSLWEPRQQVVDAFAEFLHDHADVTAIYATNAFLALVAVRAIERLGLRIPEDISFVCIDPLEAIPLALPAVTCGLQQADAIGRTAVTLLHEMMAGKPPRTVLLPMLVRKHGSIGPPARWADTAAPPESALQGSLAK